VLVRKILSEGHNLWLAGVLGNYPSENRVVAVLSRARARFTRLTEHLIPIDHKPGWKAGWSNGFPTWRSVLHKPMDRCIISLILVAKSELRRELGKPGLPSCCLRLSMK
jgi:hypothetical protein